MRLPALLIVVVLTLNVACSSVDCPLYNTVNANFKLMGEVDTLDDTLTISTLRQNGFDSVLINKQYNTDSFSLPLSYGRDEDIFYFDVGGKLDTLWISKTNEPHFESVDCGLNYFHTINGVRFTRNTIDSVTINYKEVNYDFSKKHFYIYFKKYRY